MQKIREQVVARRDLVYQHNEGEVRKRWHYEDAVSDHAVRPPPELWNALSCLPHRPTSAGLP